MAKKTFNPIIDASFILSNPKRTISISPSIDIGLSGKIGIGIPEGCWVSLSGPPKAGKSLTAMQIAANFQQQLGKKVYIGNTEHRIKPRDLTGIHNLDIEKVKIIQSEKGNILSAEDHLNEYMNLLKTEQDIVLIIDSTSALCTRDEMDDEIKADRRSKGPKLLASFCRQMTSVVPIQDNVVITIQHIIANTGPGMSTKYEDGGYKIQFQGDVRLVCSHFKVEGNEDSAGYGQEVHWKVMWSSLGAPGSKITSFIRYNHGIDKEKELIDIAKSCGLISLSGSWYECLFDTEIPKLQGEEKVRDYLFNNQDKVTKLIELINGMI